LNTLKKDNEAFFNRVYGGRYGNAPNEGYKYRGRGLNQLTFKGNYKAMNKYTDADIVGSPDLVNTLPIAVDVLIGYFLRNFSSKRNKLDEYNMTDMNSATSTADAVGAAYHANAGWGKDKAALERRNSNGRKRAFARVDDLVDYVNTIDVDAPVDTTPTPTPDAEPRKIILNSVGDGGANDLEDVKAVQRLLKAKGFNMGKHGPNRDGIDGDCGRKTKKHIKAFQKNNSLDVSGLIEANDATWKALGGATADPVTDTAPTPTPDAGPRKIILNSVGDGGTNDAEDVKAVQRLLKAKGFNMGKHGPNRDGIDGDCGRKTKKHIKAFQKNNSLDVTKLIEPNDATWKALGGAIPAPPINTAFQLFLDTLKAGSASISESVGDNGGKNKPEDVIKIKAMLANVGLYKYDHLSSLQQEGKMEDLTKALEDANDGLLIPAIYKFQDYTKVPDGRVDPNGTALGKLNNQATPKEVETDNQPSSGFLAVMKELQDLLKSYFEHLAHDKVCHEHENCYKELALATKHALEKLK